MAAQLASPSGLTEVVFSFEFNQPLVVGGQSVLPSGLTFAVFSGELLVLALPAGLTHVEFSEPFNQPLIVSRQSLVPSLLTVVEFSTEFNQPLRTVHRTDCTPWVYFPRLFQIFNWARQSFLSYNRSDL